MGGGVTDLTTLLPRPTLRAVSCTRRHDSGCAACADACPRGAWTLAEGDGPPRLEPDACIGCALCVPACPVGAIDDVGPDASTVVERVVAGAPEATVRCRVAQRVAAPAQPADAVVPCLAALDPETLAAAAARLAYGTLVLERAACEACPIAPVDRVARVLRAGAGLARAVAPDVEVTDRLLTADDATGPSRGAGRPRSRRSLFRPRVAPAPRPAGSDRPRALLLGAAPDAPLPLLAVGPACTGCGACSRVCPTGALSTAGAGDGVVLRFDPRACVDCGECARVCAEGVVTTTGRTPGPHVTIEVAHVVRGRCVRCRAELAPGEAGTCTRCRGRRSMLDDVWAALR